MGFLARFKAKVNPTADVDNNRFMDKWGYKQVWERKELPSPGAMNYAYETLALKPDSPISGAVAQRKTFSLFGPQVYKYQDAWLAGVPLVSGQIFGQPLYDPQSGYVGGNMPHSNGDLVSANIVADRMGPRPTNAPFMTNT